MPKQTIISQKFKNEKTGYSLLSQKKNKRLLPITNLEHSFLEESQKDMKTKRVDLRLKPGHFEFNDSKSSNAIASKATVVSLQDNDSQPASKSGRYELSSKTKSVLQNILQKKQQKSKKK